MIEENDLDRLKEIFVTRKECQSSIEGLSKKLHNDDKRLAVIETYQKITLWVLTAVGGGVISMAIKLFFGN